MDIVNFFGEKLAKKINKNALALSGLIRMSIRDSEKTPTLITVDELREVFAGPLKSYLEKLRIKNVDEISKYLISELNKNQSLLTMRLK